MPFCRRKCSYCGFYSVKAEESLIKAYQEALLAEVAMSIPEGLSVSTIYIGGGTPSILEGPFLRALMESISERADLTGLFEATIEVNPGVLETGKLPLFREAGFDRISIGVQSLEASLLDFLGRIHDPDQAMICIEMARRAGFEKLSADLIYGIPTQPPGRFEEDLELITELGAGHVSCYELTPVRGTPLMDRIESGDIAMPVEEKVLECYERAHELMESRGFLHYEVSSYARGEENRSLHNLGCWNGEPYLGLGPSAHSFDGRSKRWWNISDVESYANLLRNGESPVLEGETLSKGQLLLERLMLGLRNSGGIDQDEIGEPIAQRASEILESCREEGLIDLADGKIRPTSSGMLRADGMARELWHALETDT